MKEQVWLKRTAHQPIEKTPSFEKGIYEVFDKNKWKKVKQEMKICYVDLERYIKVK